MVQFEIRKDCIKEVRKAILNKGIAISLFASVFIAIGFYRSNSDLYFLLFAIPLFLVLIISGYYKGVKWQMKLYDSYNLTIDNQLIRRKQHDTPDIIIQMEDINRIIKNSNGSFTIKGNSTRNVIEVPAQIEDYERFENLLSGIKQISTKKGIQLLPKFLDLVNILAAGSIVAVMISKDKIIIGACAALVLITWGYSMFETQRSQNIDRRTKKTRWWSGIILIALFIRIVYYKLTAP
ncbi:MAG: hypothetical protein WC220_13055 [Pedobacter sp.]|jgi:hypothetical protein